MMAWGGSKAKAVERMVLGKPCPQNPAAWVQLHDNVTVFMDQHAFGDLHAPDLERNGWRVERVGANAVL